MSKWQDFNKITCKCGRIVYKDSDLFRISFYKVKTPTLKRTEKNERRLEEIFFYYVCPRCDREVVLIKRKALNAAKNHKLLFPVKLICKEASEYIELTKDNRINLTNKLFYNDTSRFVKGISMSYFKSINDRFQRPRYLNECGYSGEKVECKLKVYS